jgi:hypothetical protein
MGLKSFFGKLFGSIDEAPKVTETVEYAGYVIVAQPKPQGGQFYTAGTISKEFPDGTREQHFIRADTHSSADSAGEHAIIKARQIIDEQGDRLFKDA